MNTRYLILIVILLTVGCATRGPLDDKIAEERREIARLEAELAAASTVLPSDHNLYVALKYRGLGDWLSDITTSAYAIHGVGLQHEDELIYVPGVGKAWIEPEHGTWFDIRLRRLRLAGTSTGLDVTGNIDGDMAMRIRTYIFNMGSNVLCTGHLDSTIIKANLALTPGASNAIPFTLSLTSPSNVSIPVTCGLGALPPYQHTFQINDLAKTLSSGNIELGWSTRGTLEAPSSVGGRTYTYSLAAKNPQLATKVDRFEYATDVEVSVTNNEESKPQTILKLHRD